MADPCEVCGCVPKAPFPKELGPIRRRQLVLVEVPRIYDGALYRQCLWCLSRLHRFAPGDPQFALAAPYVAGER